MGHPVNLLGYLFLSTLICRRQQATKHCEDDSGNPGDTKGSNNDTKEKEEMEAIVVGP